MENKRDMTKGTWVRRMTGDQYRVMEDGQQVQVVIDGYTEVEALRTSACKWGQRIGCQFSVSYRQNDPFAVVTRHGQRRAQGNP